MFAALVVLIDPSVLVDIHHSAPFQVALLVFPLAFPMGPFVSAAVVAVPSSLPDVFWNLALESDRTLSWPSNRPVVPVRFVFFPTS